MRFWICELERPNFGLYKSILLSFNEYTQYYYISDYKPLGMWQKWSLKLSHVNYTLLPRILWAILWELSIDAMILHLPEELKNMMREIEKWNAESEVHVWWWMGYIILHLTLLGLGTSPTPSDSSPSTSTFKLWQPQGTYQSSKLVPTVLTMPPFQRNIDSSLLSQSINGVIAHCLSSYFFS